MVLDTVVGFGENYEVLMGVGVVVVPVWMMDFGQVLICLSYLLIRGIALQSQNLIRIEAL